MTNVVVKIEKSGNRFNAWDSDGNKFTIFVTKLSGDSTKPYFSLKYFALK